MEQAEKANLRLFFSLAAYHEAAHSVIRWARVGSTGDVSIESDGTGLSEGTGDPIRGVDALDIMITGFVAESRLDPRISLEWITERVAVCKNLDDDAGDVESIARILRQPRFLKTNFFRVTEDLQIHICTEAEAIQHCWEQASSWLDSCWPAVEALAEALLDRSSIPGPEVVQIIEQALPEELACD